MKKVMDDLIGTEHELIIKDVSTRPWGFLNYKDYNFFTFVREKCLKPGNKAKVKIIKRKKRFFISKLVSNNKTINSKICNYYNECEKCNLLHLSSKSQKNIIESKIEHFFEKNNFNYNFDLIFSQYKNNYLYTFNGKLNFFLNQDGLLKPKIGFYDESNNLIDIDDCKIHNNLLLNKINGIRDYLQIRAKRYALKNDLPNKIKKGDLFDDIFFKVRMSKKYTLDKNYNKDSNLKPSNSFSILINYKKDKNLFNTETTTNNTEANNSNNNNNNLNHNLRKSFSELIEKPFYQIIKKDLDVKQLILNFNEKNIIRKDRFLYDEIKFSGKSFKVPFLLNDINSFNSNLYNLLTKWVSKKIDLLNHVNFFNLSNYNLFLLNILSKKRINQYHLFTNDKVRSSYIMHFFSSNSLNHKAFVHQKDPYSKYNISLLKSFKDNNKKGKTFFIFEDKKNKDLDNLVKKINPDYFIFFSSNINSFINKIKSFQKFKLIEIKVFSLHPNSTNFLISCFFSKK